MFFQDRNWLITVALAHLRIIVWIGAIAAVILLAATFLFRPVYKAQAVLTLDSDFASVLRNIDIPYPAKNQSDFIRYEYFATHAVGLMCDPTIARQVIETMGLKSGRHPLKPEKFVNPSLANILFNNSGQGVGVKWISDTQQFSIAGYSRDPDQAVSISETYANTFLNNNVRQYVATLKVIIDRTRIQLAQYDREFEGIDAAMRSLREEAGSSNPASEVELINKRVSALQTTIDERKFEESIFDIRMKHLLEKQSDFENLRLAQLVLEANPMVLQIQKDMEGFAANLAKASVDFTPEHPTRRAIENQMSTLKDRLNDTVGKTLSQEIRRTPEVLDTVLTDIVKYNIFHLTYKAALLQLETTITLENQRAEKLSGIAMKLTTLSTKKEGLITRYSVAKGCLSSLEAVESLGLPAFRMVSAPYINKDNLSFYKYFPRRLALLMKCVLGVVFFSFLFVLGRDLYAQTIHRGWQIEDALPGVACTELSKTACELPPPSLQMQREILPAWKIVSRARLVRLRLSDEVASDLPLASAMVHLWQAQGRTALVIDGRLKHRHLTEMADLDARPGVADCWRGEAPVDRLPAPCKLFPASLIPAGRQINGALLIPSAAIAGDFFRHAQSLADHVLYVEGLSADDRAVILEGMPEHALLVAVKSGRTTRSSLESLAGETIPTTPWGIILCSIPLTGNLLTVEGIKQLVSDVVSPPIFFLRKWRKRFSRGTGTLLTRE